MYNEDELSDAEVAGLAALPREMNPGDLLEERVMRALRKEGHFGSAVPRTRRGIAIAWRAAAALALFTGGVATGRYLLLPQTAQTSAVRQATAISPVAERNDDRQRSASESAVSQVNGRRAVAVREMWL